MVGLAKSWALTAQIAGRSLFIYGGYNDDPAHNLHDLWGLDTTADALEWVWYNSPSNMVGRHSSAHTVAYGELIVFGGVDGGGVLLQDTLRAKLACPKGSRGPLPLKPELSTLCVQCSPVRPRFCGMGVAV